MDTNVSVQVVTPEAASRMLTANEYEFQRPIKSWFVRFLANEIKRGAFKQDTAIELCTVNGKDLLTDGRHRLSAIVEAGISQRMVVVKRVLRDDDAVALDYSRTDKGVRRITSDDYRAFQLGTELGLSDTDLNRYGSAIAMINSGFMVANQGKLHTSDRLKMMRDYNDACSNYLEVIAGTDKSLRSRLMRAATLSVALVTFRYSSTAYGDKIEKFWHGVAWDDGLRVGDARKVANRHLLETGMTGGAAGITSHRVASPAYSSRFLAQCFNAYVENRQLKQTKIYDARKPIVILGSPFNGK